MKISKNKQLKLGEKGSDSLSFSILGESFFMESPKPKKLRALKLLKNDSDKLKYILSLYGIKSKINLKREYVEGGDSLSENKNKFLNMLSAQCGSTSFKRPISKDFHFGIEIECFIPYKGKFRHCYDSGEVECSDCDGSGLIEVAHRNSGWTTDIDCPFCDGRGTREDEDTTGDRSEEGAIEILQDILKEKGIKGLHVKSDGSINPDEDCFPVEISCLTNDFKNLEKLCKVLKELDASVNTSCGLHVHLDMRNFNNDELVTIASNMETSLDILIDLVPESRRNSNYCVKRVSTDKYSAFNTGVLYKYGTIECRLHSGSTDFVKIRNWCLLLKSIVDKKERVKAINCRNLKEFQREFNLNEDLKKWSTDRFLKFSGDDTIEDSSEEESEAS